MDGARVSDGSSSSSSSRRRRRVYVCADGVVCEYRHESTYACGRIYTPCPRLTRPGYMYTTLRNGAE